MSSKDKEKVIGEDLDTAKIARFLEMEPYGSDSTDFHILLKAYRGLPVEAFERFLEMFKAKQRDINACDPQGRTLLQLATDNQRHPEYVVLLKKFGAL